MDEAETVQPTLTKYSNSLLEEARGEIRNLYVFFFMVILELCILIMSYLNLPSPLL